MKFRITCGACKGAGKVGRWDWHNDADYWTVGCAGCNARGWYWFDDKADTCSLPADSDVRLEAEERPAEFVMQTRNRKLFKKMADELKKLPRSEQLEALECIGGPEAEAIKQIMEG